MGTSLIFSGVSHYSHHCWRSIHVVGVTFGFHTWHLTTTVLLMASRHTFVVSHVCPTCPRLSLHGNFNMEPFISVSKDFWDPDDVSTMINKHPDDSEETNPPIFAVVSSIFPFCRIFFIAIVDESSRKKSLHIFTYSCGPKNIPIHLRSNANIIIFLVSVINL